MRCALAIAAIACGCKGHDAEQAHPPDKTAAPDVRPSQVPLPRVPSLALTTDAKRAEKIELGHKQFVEQCASCHDGTHLRDGRKAPALWNVAYFSAPNGHGAFFWDGRAPTLEAAVAAEAGPKATPDTPAALAEYLRTLVCNDTAYDKYAAGDKTALTVQQQHGLDVFLGKGQCGICHAPPYFSTAMSMENGIYFNTGIGTQGVPEDKVDAGRMKVTNKPADWAAFKPPTLRNVTRNAPYFHDGSVAKLDDAVKLMAAGGIANKNENPALIDRQLSDAERADVIAFLASLECPAK
jgi:cytochrome c peroxidase